MGQTKRLDFLQALRGLAALAVVLWHGSRFISPYYEGLGWQLFGAGGSMGVDLFFVISGFIMTYTTRERNNAYEFAVKRFSRIWPIYVIVTLAYILAMKGFVFWLDPQNITKFLVTLTFVPLHIDEALVIQLPALGVGWTLNYEAYFYLIFGLSLLCGSYRWFAFFGWIALSLFLVPLMAGVSEPSFSPLVNYGFSIPYMALATNPIIWLFVAGVLIGLIYQSRLSVSPFNAVLMVLAASTMYVFQYAGNFHASHGLLQGGASAVILVFCLSIASKSIVITVPRPLIVLGDVSYSLYLLHPLVQEGTEQAFRTAGQGAYANGFSFLFLTTALSIVVALVSHRLLERGVGGKTRDFLMKAKNSS